MLSKNQLDLHLIFLHSYSSKTENWSEVMIGTQDRPGRLRRAINLKKILKLPIFANDKNDQKNRRLFKKCGIENLSTAVNTKDEIISILTKSQKILFITSPDHLPRVVKEALACGAVLSMFASSESTFSPEGPKGIGIIEPSPPIIFTGLKK